jgi:predicted patatin/cPLA2 family phospholipase
MIEKCGLVLEGGGMRGVYTAGILEFFLEKDLVFPYVIGASAGACNAMSYISKQRGRNKKVTIDMASDERYIRYKGLLDGTGLFNMDFIFDEIPNNIIKYDYESYRNSNQKMVAVTTDCMTGEATYFNCMEEEDNMRLNNIIRASSSLPLMASVVEYNGQKLLDGGISDSIPIHKAMKDGYKKNIVILTRNKGYKKKPIRGKKIYERLYAKKYPGLVNALLSRYMHYNDALSLLEDLERKDEILTFYPPKSVLVKRIEKDKSKLEKLYYSGYKEAKQRYTSIKSFLDK